MNIVHICYGGPIYTIQCGGVRVAFEMHCWCGPMPVKISDWSERVLSWNHRFWTDVSQWAQQGEQVDEFGRCAYDPSIPLRGEGP